MLVYQRVVGGHTCFLLLSCWKLIFYFSLVQSLGVLETCNLYGSTLPEPNIAPENRPSQNEISIPTIHFQGRTLSFREGNDTEIIPFFFGPGFFFKLRTPSLRPKNRTWNLPTSAWKPFVLSSLPPKEGRNSNQKKGSFGFQVSVFILYLIAFWMSKF